MTPKLGATLIFLVLVVFVGLHRFCVTSMFAQPSGPWVPRLARYADQLVFAWAETPERGGTSQVRSAFALLKK